MRGVVLLVVGVLLIWLGATTSRDPSRAAESEAVEMAEASPVSLDSTVGERAVAREGPPPERSSSEEPAVAEDPEAELPVGAPRDDAPPARESGADPAGSRAPDGIGAEADTVVAALEPPASLPELRPRSSDEVGQEPPSFRLGGPSEDPTRLAVLLLEAWGDEDPQGLEEFLNDTERELPPARRRLVAAFWQALAGTPDVAAEVAAELDGAEGLTTAQLALLRAAGESGPLRAVPAAAGRRDPLARAMRMVLLQDRAVQADRTGELALAAQSWSDLIQLELGAEWAPHRAMLLDWADGLRAVQERYRLDPDADWPSLEVEVLPNDNLSEIRARVVRENPGVRVSVDMLRRLNRIGKFIHPGEVLRVPLDEPNVLVDLDARLVVYRHGTEAVLAWPCGIGKEGHETPPGKYEIGLRQTDPAYMPEGREARPFGHPENPLGTRWLAWHTEGKNTSYGIHGTWEPEGVGGRVSQGCVRMRNEDVEVLYDLLPLGAWVVVQP